jgi:hypothetical protein
MGVEFIKGFCFDSFYIIERRETKKYVCYKVETIPCMQSIQLALLWEGIQPIKQHVVAHYEQALSERTV